MNCTRNSSSKASLLVETVCCVVAADGKITNVEKKAIPDVLRKSGFSMSSRDAEKATRNFVAKANERGLEIVSNNCAANVYLEFATPES